MSVGSQWHSGCQKPHRSNKVRSMAIKDISFSTAFLQGKKLADHTAREKKKNLCRGNIRHLLQQINSKQLA